MLTLITIRVTSSSLRENSNSTLEEEEARRKASIDTADSADTTTETL